MMLNKNVVLALSVFALTGIVCAQQGTTPAGLLNQLVTPKPAAVAPVKPVVTNTAVLAPAIVGWTPAAQVTPAVGTPPPVPVVAFPPVSVVVPTNIPNSVVASTNVAAAGVDAAGTPKVTLAPPKKKKTGSSFLTKSGSSTNAPLRETVITSKKIDFDYNEGVILFDENVVVDDPQFLMKSDRLLVFMESTNDVSQVMAVGNVVFSNEMRSATCDKAVYTRKDGQVVLSGDVRLKTEEGDTTGEVRGKKVVIWVDDERVEVLDGARITLPPGTFKKVGEKERKDGEKEKKEPPAPVTK
jgi:lipopolysaccharide transport protein LptA